MIQTREGLSFIAEYYLVSAPKITGNEYTKKKKKKRGHGTIKHRLKDRHYESKDLPQIPTQLSSRIWFKRLSRIATQNKYPRVPIGVGKMVVYSVLYPVAAGGVLV